MKKIFSSKAAKTVILSLLACVPLMLAFCRGDNIRHAFNNARNAGVPPEQRDLITYVHPGADSSAAISASSISRTGQVPSHAFFSPGNVRFPNIRTNWNANDAFAQSFRQMENTAAQRIAADPALQKLRARPAWSEADSLAWESAVAEHIAGIVHNTPGFDKYRSDQKGEDGSRVPRTSRLNDLSSDILNRTYKCEFDCEAMSVVKAVLQHRLSERFLSTPQKSRYFYVSGEGEISYSEDAPGGHAFIVVERQGKITGVIEATENSSVFCRASAPCTFAEFAAGKPLVAKTGGVYGFHFTHAEADAARAEAGIKPYKVLMQELNEKKQKLQQQKLRTAELIPAA